MATTDTIMEHDESIGGSNALSEGELQAAAEVTRKYFIMFI